MDDLAGSALGWVRSEDNRLCTRTRHLMGLRWDNEALRHALCIRYHAV